MIVRGRVLVIGGAGQGRQVIDALETGGTDDVVGVLDAALAAGGEVAGYPVLGSDADLADAATRTKATGYVVAIGDNATRAALLTRAAHDCPDLTAVTVRHPRAFVARDAAIGDGCILLAGAVVSNGCRVGRGVLFGTNSSVDHDCTVDDHASLAPGAVTGGGVHVGAVTALGVGVSVIHGVTIGAHTVVGAGAAVVGDLPDHVVAVGVPARVRRPRTEGEPYLRPR